MTIWVSADQHFGHNAIRKHCHRPFTSVDEMDKVMLDNINAVVQPQDELYVLGDFSFRGGKPADYRQKIRCKRVYLVQGNHDDRQMVVRAGFEWIKDYFELRVADELWVLSHYPMWSWRNSWHGSFHLYGHVHNNSPDVPDRRCWNVGVDVNDFRPLSLEELRRKLLAKAPLAPSQMYGERNEG